MSNPKGVRATTLQLQELHKIVKPQTIDPKTGKVLRWKGIEKFRQFYEEKYHDTISDQTVRNWLEFAPEPPERERRKGVIPKERVKFYESDAYKLIKGHEYEQEITNAVFQAWTLMGEIDPLSWGAEEYRAMRQPSYQGRENTMYRLKTRDISPGFARDLRRAIQAWKLPNTLECLAELKDVPKLGEGTRIEWYLEPDEIHSLIDGIEDLDVLVYTAKCLEDGSRPIATAGKVDSKKRALPQELRFTTDKIIPAKNLIRRFETKKGVWARAKFQTETINLIQRFIADMKIPDRGDIFMRNQIYFGEEITKAGKRAKIRLFLQEKGAGAYVLRHTFATQALQHLVSIECVSEQGGWTTTDVITDYYAGLKEEKMDQEFLDRKPEKFMTWKNWILQFYEHFEKRYLEIQASMQQRERKEASSEKMSESAKKRGIPWKAVEGTVASETTKPHVKELWKKALALHNKGLSDEQVKKEMRWK